MTVDYDNSAPRAWTDVIANANDGAGRAEEKTQSPNAKPRTTAFSRATSPPNQSVGVVIRDISHSRMTSIEDAEDNNL